jgi:hypothetical protein
MRRNLTLWVLRRALLAAVVWALATQVLAATPAEIEQARAKGLAWLCTQQQGDGSWEAAGGLGVQSTATALEAMANAGIRRGWVWGSALAWLGNADAPSVDSLSRRIVALKTAGANVSPDCDLLLSWKSGRSSDGANWGAYRYFSTSFPDMPLALAAIRLSGYTYSGQVAELRTGVYCRILPAQQTDGSWSYLAPSSGMPAATLRGAILPTAYTLLELQAIRLANPDWGSDSCESENYDLPAAITDGLSWLITKRNADNGFGDDGQSTVFETALAYQVLAVVDPANPAKEAALDYLLARQDAVGGSWQGDPFQTAMVLKSLPPATLADTDGDGLPDAVEALLGTNPTLADRGPVKGNGRSVSGVSAPLLISTGEFYHSLSGTLNASGGTVPYTWSMLSGSLPEGVSLSNSGVISGKPSSAGTFNFTCKVTDANGDYDTVAGQIIVTDDLDRTARIERQRRWAEGLFELWRLGLRGGHQQHQQDIYPPLDGQ